jgi:hypothetical protein
MSAVERHSLHTPRATTVDIVRLKSGFGIMITEYGCVYKEGSKKQNGGVFIRFRRGEREHAESRHMFLDNKLREVYALARDSSNT